MTDAVTVDGADQLARTLRAANGELQDMSAAGSRAGTLIANRGRVEAPRLTGRLASSISTSADAKEAEIFSALPYAARTHWGYARYGQAAQPFLTDPAHQLMDVWSGYYTDEADRILHNVKGA